MEKSTKEDIVETTRLLTMNLAHYQFKYGAFPLEETLAMFASGKANDDQLKILIDAMKILMGVLENVITGRGQEKIRGL